MKSIIIHPKLDIKKGTFPLEPITKIHRRNYRKISEDELMLNVPGMIMCSILTHHTATISFNPGVRYSGIPPHASTTYFCIRRFPTRDWMHPLRMGYYIDFQDIPDPFLVNVKNYRHILVKSLEYFSMLNKKS